MQSRAPRGQGHRSVGRGTKGPCAQGTRGSSATEEERKKRKELLQSLSAPGWEKAEVRCKGCCGVWRASLALCPKGVPPDFSRCQSCHASMNGSSRAATPSQSSPCAVLSCPGQPGSASPVRRTSTAPGCPSCLSDRGSLGHRRTLLEVNREGKNPSEPGSPWL